MKKSLWLLDAVGVATWTAGYVLAYVTGAVVAYVVEAVGLGIIWAVAICSYLRTRKLRKELKEKGVIV